MKYHLKTDYNFDSDDCMTPDIVMKDICAEFNSITRGFVLGNVCAYDGMIESYDTWGAMPAIAAGLQAAMKSDIQDQLGEINSMNFKYELYLSVNQIESYKYRILFAGYGIAGYPVRVVLEQDIADEINQKEDSGYVYMAESKDDFERLLIRILNSGTIQKIVQNLIHVSKRKLLAQNKDFVTGNASVQYGNEF